jgi:hypothetical protein
MKITNILLAIIAITLLMFVREYYQQKWIDEQVQITKDKIASNNSDIAIRKAEMELENAKEMLELLDSLENAK